MWYLILSIFVLILYLSETLVLLPLLLMLVISHASFAAVFPSSLISFIAGIILDIGNSRFLGQTALFFLTVSLIIQIYRRRFSEENPAFLFIFSFLAINLYLWIFEGRKIISVVESFGGSVLVIIMTSILYWLWKKTF